MYISGSNNRIKNDSLLTQRVKEETDQDQAGFIVFCNQNCNQNVEKGMKSLNYNVG